MCKSALFWSIQISDRSCYLFGTMHTRHAVPFGNIAEIAPYIRSCELYCAEMDLSQFDQTQFAKSTQLTEGITLKSLLGIKIFDKCARIFDKAYGCDLESWNKIHPFMLLATLASDLLEPTYDQPFDHHLWQLVGTWGIARDGLERFADQVAIMDQIPIDSQIRAVKKLARKPQRLRHAMRKLVSLYERQDLQQLYLSSRRGLADMRRLLLDDRNRRMTDRFIEHSEHSSLFAAVGAAHLAGEYGMLRLLKLRGARLKPIPLRQYLHHERNHNQQGQKESDPDRI